MLAGQKCRCTLLPSANSITIRNSTEGSPFWETYSYSSGQEISCILWNPNVHDTVHKSPPLVMHLHGYYTYQGQFDSVILCLLTQWRRTDHWGSASTVCCSTQVPSEHTLHNLCWQSAWSHICLGWQSMWLYSHNSIPYVNARRWLQVIYLIKDKEMFYFEPFHHWVYPTQNSLSITLENKSYWKFHIDKFLPKLSSACSVITMLNQIMLQKTIVMAYYAYFHTIMNYNIIFGGNFLYSINIF
jgi:hypothetical protein